MMNRLFFGNTQDWRTAQNILYYVKADHLFTGKCTFFLLFSLGGHTLFWLVYYILFLLRGRLRKRKKNPASSLTRCSVNTFKWRVDRLTEWVNKLALLLTSKRKERKEKRGNWSLKDFIPSGYYSSPFYSAYPRYNMNTWQQLSRPIRGNPCFKLHFRMSTISGKSDKSTLGILFGKRWRIWQHGRYFHFSFFFSSKFHSRISCVNTAARHDDLEDGVCVCVSNDRSPSPKYATLRGLSLFIHFTFIELSQSFLRHQRYAVFLFLLLLLLPPSVYMQTVTRIYLFFFGGGGG
jgi:hypothetical protein